MIVCIVSPDQAISLWPQIESHLNPGLEEDGLYLPIDVLAAHLKNEMQIWVAWDEEKAAHEAVDAAMVTQIYTFPRKKICAMRYVRGRNLKAWAKLFIAKSEEFARSQGCQEMGGGHRRGWIRMAGYKETGPMLKKVLR